MYSRGDIPAPINLDPSASSQSRVIRIEIRAGKTALKERWDTTTWEDFFDRFGDLCRQTGELIRYCSPTPSDRNRSRWLNHAIWEIACAEMNNDLFEMRSGVDPSVIKEVHRETHISLLLRNITGCAITHAALNGRKFDDMSKHFTELAEQMSTLAAKSPDKSRR